MDDKTAAAQLEFLSRMLEEEGWGAHYVQACKIGSDSLKEKADAAVPR